VRRWRRRVCCQKKNRKKLKKNKRYHFEEKLMPRCFSELEYPNKTGQPLLPAVFPMVITLCGSSRFKEDHEKAQRDLTLKGRIVIPMGMYGHLEGIDMDGEIKKKLDVLHFRKIDLSDGIFVVNPESVVCGVCEGRLDGNSFCKKCDDWVISTKRVFYIGESTSNEIAYALSKGKSIEYLNKPE
jgi:hypothetical protein